MTDDRCAIISAMVIGLISDTHGLLRPEVSEAFAGVEVILHAGDVGGEGILHQLRSLAPVHAVYGNTDDSAESGLRKAFELTLEGVSIHVSHGHELGAPTAEKLLARYTADVIVFGHTHKVLIDRSDGRLVVNPGAAGPKRFNVKPSVARMTISAAGIDVHVVWL